MCVLGFLPNKLNVALNVGGASRDFESIHLCYMNFVDEPNSIILLLLVLSKIKEN